MMSETSSETLSVPTVNVVIGQLRRPHFAASEMAD
jgi:hypothetical protein